MELTEENAQAGDKAYLDLVLLQALGSDRITLIWCSTWSLIVQASLLGFAISKIWRIVFSYDRKRIAKVDLGCIGFGLALVIAQFGVNVNQTYRITFMSNYSSIAILDSRLNMVPIVSSGVLGLMSAGYGLRQLWTLDGRKGMILPFVLANLISLGLVITLAILSYQMPAASVSTLYVVKDWIKKHGILFRVWVTLNLMTNGGLWIALTWNLRRSKEHTIDVKRKARTICHAFILPVLDLAILLIYSCIEIPSLANASRPIIASLSPAHLICLLYLLDLKRAANTSDEQGDLYLPESSSVYYKSPPISKKGLIPYCDAYSTYTTSTASASASGSGGSRSVRTGKGALHEGSVRVIIDKHVSEKQKGTQATHIPAPPSAYTYGEGGRNSRSVSRSVSRAHTRHISSPLATPVNSNYHDVSLSLIADPNNRSLTSSAFVNHNNVDDQMRYASDSDGDDGGDGDRASYKSAVPSGKTLLRTKSERSKKDRGIVLDHEGWNRINVDPPFAVPIPVPVPAPERIPSMNSIELKGQSTQSRT